MTERLSIVVPVYNEAGSIARLIVDLDRAILARLPSAEIIVVDDASTDGSAALLDRLAETHSRLHVEHGPRNLGHGPTVCRAIDLSSGGWIFQLDSDLQCDVDDFWLLWDRRQGAELVLGVRAARRDPRHRLLLSRASSAAVGLLGGRRIRDPNVPFRLIRRELWDELSPRFPSGELALTPSLLVSVGAAYLGRPIVEVPVTHRPRPHGSSSLRILKLLSLSARALADLVAYRARLARSFR